MTEAANAAFAPASRRRGYLMAAGSFVAKGAFAFVMTYLLANHLAPTDFGFWSTVFSFGMILGVSELGVGQFILTAVHESRSGLASPEGLFSNAVALMLVIAVAAFLVAAGVLGAFHSLTSLRGRDLLIAIILLRLLAVPFGAYLSALGRYHERKVAEALSYGASAAFVFWGIRADASVGTLLLGANAVITVGTLALALRARALGVARVRVADVSIDRMRHLLSQSFPYFVGNVSTLATYGGFIALSSLVMASVEVARLSLLHSIVLMHTLQVFDLMFKSVQPRMHTEGMLKRLRALVATSYAVSVLGAGLVGAWVMAKVFRQYVFTPGELILYLTFVFLEIHFLLATSAMQMRSAMRIRLQWLCVAKAVGFGAVLLVAHFTGAGASILKYTAVLVGYSAVLNVAASQVSRASRLDVPEPAEA